MDSRNIKTSMMIKNAVVLNEERELQNVQKYQGKEAGLYSTMTDIYWMILSKVVTTVQFISRVQLLATPWTTAQQASLSITNSQGLLKVICIESVIPPNRVILCCPLLLVPSILPSVSIFSNESVLHIRWPKYWSFSFSISPSNEYSGLIFLRMGLFDLLAVQSILKSLLQHYSSKASILWCSAFFMVQLPHPYMTAGKTIVLTGQNLLTE